MQAILPPQFPHQLDTDTVLYHVFNTSEAQLLTNFNLADDIIYIEPREWDQAEKWYKTGGLINLEGEVIYYHATITEDDPNSPSSTNKRFNFFDDPNISEKIKNQYRRVTGFTNLVRMYSTVFNKRTHIKGEWARGYVMAEHHNALKQAMLGAEKLIGIDNSIDHQSLDYRLRDLEELIIEKDDLNCPYGVFWHEIIDSSEFEKTVQFHISIIGDFERFEFIPREGIDPIINDLEPIYTYGVNEDISASLTVFLDQCCACVSSGELICEPCEFDPAIDEIPILECPEIEAWNPNIPNVDIEISVTCPECPILTTDVAPTLTLPTIITLTGFSTEITLTVPEINLTSPTVDVNINVEVTWSGQDPQDGGACFMLVPCGGTGT